MGPIFIASRTLRRIAGADANMRCRSLIHDFHEFLSLEVSWNVRYSHGVPVGGRDPDPGRIGGSSSAENATLGRIMNARQPKIPGPDHPITLAANPARVLVRVAGALIADTREALILREASYPPVPYIPRKDVDMKLLQRTDHTTYCPYKGDCSYYSIPIGGERSINAVWTYETPYPAVAQITDYVAFYPSRVDAIEERPAA
jgi:uncharacterized protein (DUF427 family)